MSLTSNQELLHANGNIISPSNPSNYYLDYTSFNDSSSLDYSMLSWFGSSGSTSSNSGFRYVTYVWKIPTSSLYSSVNFVFQSVINYNITTGVLKSTGASGQSDVQVYYRIEDALKTFPSDSSSVSSYWINANALGTMVTASNYYSSSITNLSGLISVTSQSSNITLIEILPNSLSSMSLGNDYYIYLRVGLSYISTLQFSSVKASF